MTLGNQSFQLGGKKLTGIPTFIRYNMKVLKIPVDLDNHGIKNPQFNLTRQYTLNHLKWLLFSEMIAKFCQPLHY